MSNLAEKLQEPTTAEVAVVADATEWLDSDGNELKPGDPVYVAVHQLHGEWDWEDGKDEWVPGRRFDTGTVASVNPDGTVSVDWDNVGCSCFESRVEKPSDLTTSDEESVAELAEIVDAVRAEGFENGKNANQRALRVALGLPDPSTENDN